MNILQFITDMSRNWAWPITTLIIFFTVLANLSSISQLIENIKFGSIDIYFSKKLGKASEEIRTQIADSLGKVRKDYKEPSTFDTRAVATDPDLIEIAQINPSVAIAESWRRLEEVILEKFPSNIQKNPQESAYLAVLTQLLKQKKIERKIYNQVIELKKLRDVAVHYDSDITETNAYAYLDTVANLQKYIGLIETK